MACVRYCPAVREWCCSSISRHRNTHEPASKGGEVLLCCVADGALQGADSLRKGSRLLLQHLCSCATGQSQQQATSLPQHVGYWCVQKRLIRA